MVWFCKLFGNTTCFDSGCFARGEYRNRATFLSFIILIAFFSGILTSSNSAQAAVIFSDRFDSQPTWNMSQNVNLLTGWSQKLGVNRGGNYEVGYISAAGARGNGKGFIQYWDKTSSYGSAQDCWLMKNNINLPDEWYLGYWFQIDPTWSWGSVSSLKLLKVHFNDGTTWDIYWTNFCAGCPSYNVPTGTGRSLCTDEYGRNWTGSWNALGTTWHYFIWKFKHSTGTVELSVDGVPAAKTNYSTNFRGTGWDNSYGISFGGNITDGGGGVAEQWTKYDDIIIATTRSEVETFLTGTQGIQPPPNFGIANQ